MNTRINISALVMIGIVITTLAGFADDLDNELLWNGRVVEDHPPVWYAGIAHAGLDSFRILPSGYREDDDKDGQGSWGFGDLTVTWFEVGLVSSTIQVGVAIRMTGLNLFNEWDEFLLGVPLPDGTTPDPDVEARIRGSDIQLSGLFAYTLPGAIRLGNTRFPHRAGMQVTYAGSSESDGWNEENYYEDFSQWTIRPFYQLERPWRFAYAFLRAGVTVPVGDAYRYFIPSEGSGWQSTDPVNPALQESGVRNYQALSALGPFVTFGFNLPIASGYNFRTPRFYIAEDVDVFGRLR